MMITVVYGKVINMDAARRCQRCRGDQRERYGPRKGLPCPRCDGTGVRPEGYAYGVPEGVTVALGDVVECPPTPYSNGAPVPATVVGLDAEPFPGKPVKTIIRRLDAWPVRQGARS